MTDFFNINIFVISESDIKIFRAKILNTNTVHIFLFKFSSTAIDIN